MTIIEETQIEQAENKEHYEIAKEDTTRALDKEVNQS